MTAADMITFAFVATLLVMSPGPNGVLIGKTISASGKAAGFANVAGFVTGFYLHGAMAIFGLSVILVQSSTAFATVKYVGAAYLCWMGLSALISAWRGDKPVETAPGSGTRKTLGVAYVEGFITNALNPKVSMFYLAAFPQFITQGDTSISTSALLVFIHSLINALWFSGMVILFARLKQNVRKNSYQRWIKGVTGVAFLGFGAKLATFRTGV